MNADELIDDVAREMTAVSARPALRTRVLAGIGGAAQEPPRGWVLPVAAGSVITAIALAWFLVPSRPALVDPPVVARQAPMVVSEPASAQPAAIQITRATPAPPGPAAATAGVAFTWDTAPPADLPGLPPLAGPPPIVIEPITWDEVTIAPVTVGLIEVKALVVEPLASADRSGA